VALLFPAIHVQDREDLVVEQAKEVKEPRPDRPGSKALSTSVEAQPPRRAR
jgi:hypothetical protein